MTELVTLSPSATSAIGNSVAGLMVWNVLPLFASTNSLLMNNYLGMGRRIDLMVDELLGH